MVQNKALKVKEKNINKSKNTVIVFCDIEKTMYTASVFTFHAQI